MEAVERVGNVASDPAAILKKSGLKKTLGRIKIIEALMEQRRPLTGRELLVKLGSEAVDSASVYRTLNTFFELGVVHRIEGSDNINRFALNRGGKVHPHFTCRTCGRMECLEEMDCPSLNFDREGYLVERESFFLIGLCPRCRT
jgi:Fe2+ or Zn2+ uptake regulation protein